jgi:hypothetical protein
MLVHAAQAPSSSLQLKVASAWLELKLKLAERRDVEEPTLSLPIVVSGTPPTVAQLKDSISDSLPARSIAFAWTVREPLDKPVNCSVALQSRQAKASVPTTRQRKLAFASSDEKSTLTAGPLGLSGPSMLTAGAIVSTVKLKLKVSV